MRRFLIHPEAVKGDCIHLENPAELKHLIRVLRMKTGDRAIFADESAFEYECVIESVKPERVVARIEDKRRPAGEPDYRVDLFQATPKHPKMEAIIQKAVELGVAEVTPVLTERTLAGGREDVDKRRERWQKIAAEAVKQCRRGKVPPIRQALFFEEVMREFARTPYDLILFPYENERTVTLRDALAASPEKPPRTALLIGPEGGFSEAEADSAVAAGAKPVSLGRTILRAETAGPATLAMLRYEWEL